MNFGAAERREVEALMSKVASTLDGVGRTVREARLMKRLNPEWPPEVFNGLADLENTLMILLDGHSAWEESMAEVLQHHVPPGTAEPG